MLLAMTGKPGRPRSLTLEQIARAALDDGLSDFSMPSVARRLGVAHSALYRYVTDREALLASGIALAISETEWPDSDQAWDQLLPALGEAIWDLCDRNPGLDRAALNVTHEIDETTEHFRGYVRSMHEQGFGVDDAGVALDFVYRIALSASAEQGRLRRIGGPNGDVSDELKVFASDEAWGGRGLYERQLRIAMTGIAALRIDG